MPVFIIRGLSVAAAALLIVALFSNSVYAAKWQLEREDGDVRLYSRDTDNSPLKSYKVITKVKASLSSLVAFLNDHKAYPQWMDKVDEVKAIQQYNEKESLHYQVISIPWPERDQDNILYSRWSQDPKTLVLTKDITSQPLYMEPKSNIKRQKFFQGKWQLIPLANGVVEVIYTAEIDPGVVKLNPWIKKMLTYDMPVNTMKNFRAANLNKYSNAKFAFVKEPMLTGNFTANN